MSQRFVEDQGSGALAARSCAYPIPPGMEILDYAEVRNHVRARYQARAVGLWRNPKDRMEAARMRRRKEGGCD